jgi:hypothetical protein
VDDVEALFQSRLQGLRGTKISVVRNRDSNASDTHSTQLMCSIAMYFITTTNTIESGF